MNQNLVDESIFIHQRRRHLPRYRKKLNRKRSSNISHEEKQVLLVHPHSNTREGNKQQNNK
jgi:hypothetical protein